MPGEPEAAQSASQSEPDDCVSCGERMPEGECPSSKRRCGHHCNHSWSHDACDWCRTEFKEIT